MPFLAEFSASRADKTCNQRRKSRSSNGKREREKTPTLLLRGTRAAAAAAEKEGGSRLEEGREQSAAHRGASRAVSLA